MNGVKGISWCEYDVVAFQQHWIQKAMPENAVPTVF